MRNNLRNYKASFIIYRKAISVLLCLGIVASLCLGLRINSLISRAEEITHTDTSTGITWGYTISGDKAINVHIISIYMADGAYYTSDSSTITVPDHFTAQDGTVYRVYSLGRDSDEPGRTNPDRFFGHLAKSHIAPAGITIDASHIDTLTSVNTNVLKGCSNTTLKLPKSITTVGSGVLGKVASVTNSGENNSIECDALNASYGNKNDIDSSTFKFTGFKNSTAYDTFGDLLKGYPDDQNDDRFISSSADSSIGSFKYIVSTESLNTDTHTTTTFTGPDSAPFSKYIYKSTPSTDAGYTKYNTLAADALPRRRDYHTFDGYYTSASGTDVIKVFNGTPSSASDPAAGSLNTSANLSGITTKEVTLYAHWTPGNVTITFNSAGASSGTMPTAQTIQYGTAYTIPVNQYTKAGHTFTGWTDSDPYINIKKYDDQAITDPLYKNTVLSACWTSNTVTIKYNNNGGSGSIPDQQVTMSTSTSEKLKSNSSNLFTRSGYNFRCWKLKNAAGELTGTPYTENHTTDDVIRADANLSTDNNIKNDPYHSSHSTVTLYAEWEKASYLIHYYDDLVREVIASETRECGTLTPLLSRANIPGYSFEGWSTSPNGTTEYRNNTPLTRDLTAQNSSIDLYANYKPYTYTVKYIKSRGDEGDNMNPTVCTYGSNDPSSKIKDCSYTRIGCRFAGWKKTTSETSPDAEILPASSASSIHTHVDYMGPFPMSINHTPATDGETIYLYPVWIRNTYTAHFQGEGTTGISDISLVHGDSFTLPELTMPNHTFKGWMESDTLHPANTVINNVARNLTFTAAWDNDHFITITPDSMIKSITAKVNGIQKTLVSNGTITNLTFKGGESFTDIVITAVSNQLITLCTIKDDSGTVKGNSSPPSPSASVTINSVTFPQNSNLNFTINVKPQEYKITFNLDGGTIIGSTPTKYTYGTELQLPTYVVKDNAKFYGWKNSYGTIVTSISKTQAGDLTFTAVWENPNVTDLPKGATAVASSNGKYVTITYANKTTEDVLIAAQGISLKNGSNPIQFKTADGKIYLTSVNYTVATDLPQTIKAYYTTGASTASIVYPDGTTQTVAVNKYNSDTTLYGTKIYFDGIDGKRYTVVPSSEDPSASPKPSAPPSGDPRKPQSDEYYMISKVSYNVRSGKASATNPIEWNSKSITIKDKVKIYDKYYKVTKISKDAFYGMQKLEKLIVGKYVTSIGANAARDCKKLKLIKIMTGNITSVGKNSLKNTSKKLVIYIKASKSKYSKLKKLIKKKSGCHKNTAFHRINP